MVLFYNGVSLGCAGSALFDIFNLADREKYLRKTHAKRDLLLKLQSFSRFKIFIVVA